MAEENTNKRPKTTLIKHKKSTPAEQKDATAESTSVPHEKKKVVVVKKKKVVVKRPVAHQPAASEAKQQPKESDAVKEHKTSAAVSQRPSGSAQPVRDEQAQRRAPSQQTQGDRRPGSYNRDQAGTERRTYNDQRSYRDGSDRNAGYSQRQQDGDRRPYTGGQRPQQGDRRPYTGGQRPPQGDRRPYTGGQRPQNGDRRPYTGGQRPQQGDRRPYTGGQRPQQGDRRPYTGGQRPQQGDGRPYTGGQRPQQGDRRPYTGGQRPQQGDRRPYTGGQRPQQGDRRPYTGGQRPQQGDRRPYTGGGQRPQQQTPAVQGKTANKKSFKPKTKKSYQKSKRETIQERDFQLKKKQAKRANPVPKKIDIMEVITVSELARKMNLKASELIGKLMQLGMMVTINQQIDSDTATILAGDYGCEVNLVSLYDETVIETEVDNDSDLKARPPIVTVMGHVDHGKTKLLDAIRESDVVAGEFGGITQHIGAYSVSTDHGKVVFLDTPGHSAFTLMRARGAQVTDIVILVVAANDGVMPQTIEAINHAKEADVPIIVAINKVDLPESNPDRVKQQLSEYNLMPESWGGSTLFCEISALKREGIDNLVETILLQAEMLELQANYNCRAEGKIIESKVDHGRGIVSSVIIQRGTLHVGDPFIAGIYSGKVRAMFDDKGNKITEATPATPVEILGFTGIPSAGAPFQCTENERQARQVGSKRQELEKIGEAKNVKKITLDNLFDSIQDGEVQELKVIIKGDVHGSVEALQSSLEKLSTPEIRLQAIHASAGAIIENDINLAIASNAIVIGFNVRPTPKAQLLAEREKIDIRKYNIIYDVVDDIKAAMEGMLKPDYKEEVIGQAEIRDTFKVPKIGVIAGCYVTEGKVKRNATAHVIRDSVEIHTGKITSLKRFKDDAKDVLAGFECGIGIENFQDLKVGDIFEVVEIVEVAKKL